MSYQQKYIPHADDVLAQADLISSLKFCTLWISGGGIFIAVFSSMQAVPDSSKVQSVKNLMELLQMIQH